MAEEILGQLTSIVGDLASIHYWFITHTHYDHCALVPYLVRFLPNAVVVLSERGAHAFQSVRTHQVISTLNREITKADGEHINKAQELLDVPEAWHQIPLRVVTNGDSIELGCGQHIQAISTPGHSRCSMSYLVEKDGLLLVSDALGEIITPTNFLPLVFDDAISYRNSLEILATIRPRIVGLGHHGLLMDSLGEKAAEHAMESLSVLTEVVHKRSLDGNDELIHLTEELTRNHWCRSQDILSEVLHKQSMARMISLLQ